MDIYCPKCQEPWDFDSLHEAAELRHEGQPYEHVLRDVRRDFTRNGCRVLGGRCSTRKAHPAVAEVYALLGDDIDGAASLLDDFEYLGYLD